MAMIYKVSWKRKSGEISQRWCVEWTNENREKRRKLFASALDAKRHRRLIENGDAPFEETHISFANAADDFIESRRNLGRERSTYDMYERQVRMHLGPLIGARDVRSLRRADFVKLQEDLVAKLSRSLARSVFMTAKSVMAHVVRREWREGDPTTGLRFDLSSREKARIDAPRKSDIQALLDALGGNEIAAGAPPTRGYVFVRLALGSGLRASELRGLRVTDVDLEATPPTVKVFQRADQWCQIGPPKSRNGRRTVPIGPDLAMLLCRWIPLRSVVGSPLLFPAESGRPMDMSNFHIRIWRPAMRKAGLEDRRTGKARWTFHFLRHIYASQLIEMKLNPKQIQMRLGHGSVQMTLDTYGHLWRDTDKEILEVAEFERRMLGISTTLILPEPPVSALSVSDNSGSVVKSGEGSND